ncbi:MAG: S8 family peptidase, partial [Pyrinomonadaceae bacterium]
GAYARGLSGKGVKLGDIDDGTYRYHPEFSEAGKFIALNTQGVRTLDDPYNPNDPKNARGQPFNLDGGMPYFGLFGGKYKFDAHGTHTGGTIAAQRDHSDGGMFGVAWGSTLYATNGAGLGPNLGTIDTFDPAIFATEVDQLIASHVIAINNSWGISPLKGKQPWQLPDVIDQYVTDTTHLNLDAAERAAKAGVVMVFSAGNEYGSQSDAMNGLPYFRPDPEIEQHFVGVANLKDINSLNSTSSVCGYTKYWCVSAPGTNILSAVVTGEPDHLKSDYDGTYSGTSMAAPHVTGALGLLAERYSYLTTAQLREVMLTTARDLGAAGVDSTFGWGRPNLDKAMNGPGQFLGRVEANLSTGENDTWSNDISQVALDQRKREETDETAGWAKRKKEKGWESGIG